MELSEKQKLEIEAIICKSLRNRFKKYNPEPAVMPFHTRLLGKDRLALYAFIHSLNTNFGTSIFEPVALCLASNQFKVVKTQIKSGTSISKKAQAEIQEIIDNLTTVAKKPDKQEEINIIREVCQDKPIQQVKPTKVDIYLEDRNGKIYMIDLKTAKPNKGGFKEFKRTLLEWVATFLYERPKAKIETFIAIPYNPYEPKPYSRWTMAGMLDIEKELKVADEFWDFLGGKGTYQDLLDCFEKAGMQMREEIDQYFQRFLS